MSYSNYRVAYINKDTLLEESKEITAMDHSEAIASLDSCLGYKSKIVKVERI